MRLLASCHTDSQQVSHSGTDEIQRIFCRLFVYLVKGEELLGCLCPRMTGWPTFQHMHCCCYACRNEDIFVKTSGRALLKGGIEVYLRCNDHFPSHISTLFCPGKQVLTLHPALLLASTHPSIPHHLWVTLTHLSVLYCLFSRMFIKS